MSPKANVVRAVRGADGEVRVTISWMASRNFNRWRGLLHDRKVEIRYWNQTSIIEVPYANFPLDFRVWKCWHNGSWFNISSASCNVPGWHAHPQFQPSYYCRTVPQGKRCSSFHSFRQQFMPEGGAKTMFSFCSALKKWKDISYLRLIRRSKSFWPNAGVPVGVGVADNGTPHSGSTFRPMLREAMVSLALVSSFRLAKGDMAPLVDERLSLLLFPVFSFLLLKNLPSEDLIPFFLCCSARWLCGCCCCWSWIDDADGDSAALGIPVGRWYRPTGANESWLDVIEGMLSPSELLMQIKNSKYISYVS